VLITSVATIAQAQANPKVYTPQFDESARQQNEIPNVQVWLEDQSYRFGDVVRPYVASDPGAYITVIRVSTDGQLSVLYPQNPASQVPYEPARFANDRLPITADQSFLIKESSGTGFVFAVASNYKFNYRYYSSGRVWSSARLANAGRFGSPFQIVRSFVEEITEGSSSYSMDYVMYDVDGSQSRSRYASRFGHYGYDDYYESCLNAFGGYYDSYCRGYNGYGYPYIVVSTPRTNPGDPGTPRKTMHIRPLVHDPVLPHAPRDPQIVEGRLPAKDPNDAIERARHERMLNGGGGRPRTPSDIPLSERPMSQPRGPSRDPVMASPSPRAEPRMDPPRIEQRRADPPPAPVARIERSDPPPRERPKKDN
jgi:hypothetical protein